MLYKLTVEMRLFAVFCFLLSYSTRGSFCRCVFDRFDKDKPPLFTAKVFDSEQIVLKPHQSSININEGAEINAYCHVEFGQELQSGLPDYYPRSYDYESEHYLESEKYFKVHCHKGQLFYAFGNNGRRRAVDQHLIVSCSQTISLHKAESSSCNKSMIAYGLDFTQSQPTVMGDICFDLESMEVVFVHYRSKQNEHLTDENMLRIWMPQFTIYSNAELSTDFMESNIERTAKLNASLQTSLKHAFKSHHFRFDDLVHSQYFLKGYNVESQMLAIGAIPWWINLRDGNWKLVEKLVDGFISINGVDVYTGVLHNDERDSNQVPITQKLHYSLNSNRNKIPLYIWKYMKSINPYEAHNDIVVIGINNPFLKEDEIIRLKFCNDRCDTVNWLRELSPRRKFIALGYVFCCKPNEARSRIHVIQQIQYSARNEYAVTS